MLTQDKSTNDLNLKLEGLIFYIGYSSTIGMLQKEKHAFA